MSTTKWDGIFPPSYKPHPDWPGYGGDTDGNIYSTIPGRRPRILKPWVKDCGHHCVSLRRNGETIKILVHRFILELHVGPCPEGLEACHGKEGPAVNATRNLRWDTRRENTIDRYRDGLVKKLLPAQVLIIRNRRLSGEGLRQIANDFGVTGQLVSLIAKRKIWNHI